MNPEPEISLDESIKQVMQTLPPVIRAYLAEGKYTIVAKSLMMKYGLRVDQAGVLERELMLLLMGIDSPDEFTQALTEEARLDQKKVNDLVREVNDLVFVPLRNEEEGKGKRENALPTVKAALPERGPGLPQLAKPAEVVRLLVPEQPAKPAMMTVPNVVPLPPKVATPQAQPATTLGDVVRSILPAASLESKGLLEDHEEPHINIPMPLVPVHLPGTMPAIPAPVVLQPQPIKPKQPIPPTPSIPITSYTTDPYREPVDESPTA